MPHDLPKAYDPTAIEDHWAEYWVRENLFAQPTPPPASASKASARPSGQDPFTILLPPPNVTGRLHMGHMLNQTEMDILTRWRRMQGRRALWLPGTDHAGIATQMMVERQLVEEGTTRQQLGREAFVERVWEWKRHYGGAILSQISASAHPSTGSASTSPWTTISPLPSAKHSCASTSRASSIAAPTS